jgi:hypothetical protein
MFYRVDTCSFNLIINWSRGTRPSLFNLFGVRFLREGSRSSTNRMVFEMDFSGDGSDRDRADRRDRGGGRDGDGHRGGKELAIKVRKREIGGESL